MREKIIYYKRNLPHYQSPDHTFFITFRLAGSLPVWKINQLKEERDKEYKRIAGYDNELIKTAKYRQYNSQYFVKFDKLLDNSDYGPKWLGERGVAEIVKNTIHYYDEKKYHLICYCIMPNHIHMVIKPVDLIVDRSGTSGASINNSNITNTRNSAGSASRYIKPKPVDLIVDRSGTSGASINNSNITDTRNSAGSASRYIITRILQDLKCKTAIRSNKFLNRSGAFWQNESYDHVVRNEDELYKIIKYILNNPVKAGLCLTADEWEWSYYKL
jgi:putative transposase